MKKILSLLLVCVLLVGCAVSLTSCGKKLSGKYELDAAVASTAYEFSGSKVTITYEILGFEKSLEGKYEITTNDDDEDVIIFTFEDDAEDSDKYEGEFSFAEGKEGDTEYIKIGGIKYVKVD